jgi:hypothetical protein
MQLSPGGASVAVTVPAATVLPNALESRPAGSSARFRWTARPAVQSALYRCPVRLTVVPREAWSGMFTDA